MSLLERKGEDPLLRGVAMDYQGIGVPNMVSRMGGPNIMGATGFRG